jgi:hypothetical protein
VPGLIGNFRIEQCYNVLILIRNRCAICFCPPRPHHRLGGPNSLQMEKVHEETCADYGHGGLLEAVLRWTMPKWCGERDAGWYTADMIEPQRRSHHAVAEAQPHWLHLRAEAERQLSWLRCAIEPTHILKLLQGLIRAAVNDRRRRKYMIVMMEMRQLKKSYPHLQQG